MAVLMADAGASSGAQLSLDLATYIAKLPANVKAAVFASPWTAQALFRALPPLAKQYILRLLYVDAPVSTGARE
jgi:transcription initiation factor TFIIH subunit 4